jgi:hypothetical protein
MPVQERNFSNNVPIEMFNRNNKENIVKNKPIIVFDFDGVIHSYQSGWKGINIIPDKPVEGIYEVISELRKEYKVIIVSSRCSEEIGINAIKLWLDKYSIVVDGIQKEKPPVLITIDDRAITFDGNCNTLIDKIKGFKVWYKK